MEINFSGKRALVTGAAQGIGFAVVKKLVSCGAQVVALDVKHEELMESLGQMPGVETVVTDLSNWKSTLEVLKNIGHLQLVVNNAGVHYRRSAQEMEEDVVDKTLDVNLKAVMAVCKHVVNEWTSCGLNGSIVNIASVLAHRPDKDKVAYSASKAAVWQYTRCLALDCAPKGIRVNSVSPGLVRTPMAMPEVQIPEYWEALQKTIPTKDKFCEPEDIANAVAFLLCDQVARKITGSNLCVDNGFMLT